MGQMINELQVMRQEMRHPNIVRYHKTFREGRKCFIGPDSSVGYRTGNHYRLSEYTGRLIIDYTIENYIHFTKTVISIKQTCYMCTWPCFSHF